MEAFARGREDCYQDQCENTPFASVGGLDARNAPEAPTYVADADKAEYVAGYCAMASELYGEDWRTCSFGWRPVLTIDVRRGRTLPGGAPSAPV